MSRYIDADALESMLLEEYDKAVDVEQHTLKMIFEMLSAQPTADVVDVVRCKDCKWFNRIGCAIYIVDDSDKPTENDYCSFGERREDERNDVSIKG